jgi:predicted SnoaL-like aldol condensation-catalyzing enzyme
VSPESNRAVVRRFAEEIWRDRRFEVVDEIFSPDYADAEIPAPALDSIKRYFALFFERYPDYRVTSIDLIAEGDRVVHFHTGENRNDDRDRGPAGTVRLHREVNIFTLANGRIVAREGVGQSLFLDPATRKPVRPPNVTRIEA